MRIATIPLISGAVGLSLAGAAAQAASPVLGTQVTTSMVGDANGDGVANAKDMAIVQQNLGKPGTRAHPASETTPALTAVVAGHAAVAK